MRPRLRAGGRSAARSARTAIPRTMIPAQSCACAEWGDVERFCDLVNLRHDRRMERHPVAFPLGPARRPSHSRYTNVIAARKRPRGDEVANVAIDLGLEGVRWHEARDVEGDHELPDIALAAGGRGEIADVTAEGGAVKRSRQQADDNRESAALVVSHREISALVDAARIRNRRSVIAILNPALRHRLAFELVSSN